MKNLFATSLAVLLVFANVACVCASQIAASSDQHVHHATSDSGAEELPDCPHLDCAGDCSPQSFVRLLDRDATQKLSIKFDGFDDFEIDGAFSLATDMAIGRTSSDPPAHQLLMSAITPVQRKDLLLE